MDTGNFQRLFTVKIILAEATSFELPLAIFATFLFAQSHFLVIQ